VAELYSVSGARAILAQCCGVVAACVLLWSVGVEAAHTLGDRVPTEAEESVPSLELATAGSGLAVEILEARVSVSEVQAGERVTVTGFLVNLVDEPIVGDASLLVRDTRLPKEGESSAARKMVESLVVRYSSVANYRLEPQEVVPFRLVFQVAEVIETPVSIAAVVSWINETGVQEWRSSVATPSFLVKPATGFKAVSFHLSVIPLMARALGAVLLLFGVSTLFAYASRGRAEFKHYRLPIVNPRDGVVVFVVASVLLLGIDLGLEHSIQIPSDTWRGLSVLGLWLVPIGVILVVGRQLGSAALAAALAIAVYGQPVVEGLSRASMRAFVASLVLMLVGAVTVAWSAVTYRMRGTPPLRTASFLGLSVVIGTAASLAFPAGWLLQ